MGQEVNLALHRYLAEAGNVPFEWGENDCCLFVARFADIITGSRIAREFAGKYNTQEGAKNIVKSLGLKTTADLADRYLKRVACSHVGRGDVVTIAGALGLCDGRKSYFFVENIGLLALRTSSAVAAWGISCRK